MCITALENGGEGKQQDSGGKKKTNPIEIKRKKKENQLLPLLSLAAAQVGISNLRTV